MQIKDSSQDQFFRYLVENRGLVEASALNYCYWISRIRKSGLSAEDFIGKLASGSSRTNARVAAQHWARWKGEGELDIATGRMPERAVPSYRPRAALEGLLQYLHREHSATAYLCASLMYRAGLRVQELAKLRVRDVDLVSRQVLVHGKGRKQRRVPMAPSLYRALDDYITDDMDPEQWLLTGTKGGKLPTGTAAHVQWKQEVYDALKATGNWGLHERPMHWLRHMFAVHFIEAGGTINALAPLLGHSNLNTTMIYLRAAGLQDSTKILEDADNGYNDSRESDGAGRKRVGPQLVRPDARGAAGSLGERRGRPQDRHGAPGDGTRGLELLDTGT